jgi:hypothetical protein
VAMPSVPSDPKTAGRRLTGAPTWPWTIEELE